MRQWKRHSTFYALAAMLLCRLQPASSSAADLPSAASEYLIDTWTSDDGLPQNSVISMAQTKDGFLWLSTFDGLARFDGKRFDVFNGDEVPALFGEVFSSLAADKAGNLWLRGEQNRLVLVRQGQFRQLGPSDGLPSGGAAALHADRDGAIWIGDEKGRLLKWAGDRFVVVEATPPASNWGGMRTIEFDAAGNVWASKGTRVARLAGGKWSMIFQNEGEKSVGPMRSLRDGSMAMVAGRQVDRLYRYSEGRLSEWDVIPGGFGGFFIAEDPDENLWVSRDSGLLRRDPKGRWTELTRTNGLPTDRVRSEFLDLEGNRWFGTDGGGLLRLKHRAVRAFGVAEGLPRKVALSVAVDQTNGAWIALLEGGLNHFDGVRFSQITSPGWLEADQLVWCVRPAQDGGVWVGTYSAGIFHLDGAGTHLQQFDSHSYPEMVDGNIQALFESHAGDLWIGSGDGVSQYSHGQFHRFTTANGLADKNVSSIEEDRSGAIWVGTQSGLNRIAGQDIKTFTAADGLAGNSVRALFCDSEGDLWIGGRELTRLKQGRFRVVRAKDGLSASPIKGIIEDDLGYLWFATGHGVLRASRSHLDEFCDTGKGPVEFLSFSKSDGLPSDECSGYEPSVSKDPDGRLWFATLNGLAVIDPKRLPKNELPPPVVIESVLADGEQLPLSQDQTGAPLRVPAGTLRLEFHFAALSFTAPEKDRFRFRLASYDEDWSSPDGAEVASYTKLPPGDYRFEVRACNNDGVWNNAGASLAIALAPFFWQTAWFRALVVFLAAGLVYAYVRSLLKRAERRRLAQETFARQVIETQEAERQRIAHELHDGVGQILLLVKNHLTLGMKKAEATSPGLEHFGQASSAASQAIDEVRATAHTLRPVELDRLGLGKALESMLDRIASTTTTRCSFDLDDVGESVGREVEIQLYRIAQEAINNVLKHSKAGEVNIELKQETKNLRLTVQDDGAGFDPARSVGKGGIGLSGMAERARLIGGLLSVMAAPGKGCRLTVTVPLSK
jgi:signal transduction histidine kinase/ligand-binding sensor domain-containing protein